MDFMAIVSTIIEILLAGLTNMATGIGAGLSKLAESIFLDTSTPESPTLSVFGGLIITFGGVALSITLSTFVVKWLASFGKRK